MQNPEYNTIKPLYVYFITTQFRIYTTSNISVDSIFFRFVHLMKQNSRCTDQSALFMSLVTLLFKTSNSKSHRFFRFYHSRKD